MCPFCSEEGMASRHPFVDIWEHFLVSHMELVTKYIEYENYFESLRNEMEGDIDDDDDDDDLQDERYKNLSQDAVMQMTSLGFSIEWCQFALAENGGNLENAINLTKQKKN